jgi:two-component system nitrate/nitrite sensor histidine kinase NarX
MEKRIRTIRWVTFAALLTSAAAFMFQTILSKPAILGVQLFLVIISALFLTWALESWLRFFISHTAETNFLNKQDRGMEKNPDIDLLMSFNQNMIKAQSIHEVVQALMQAGILLFGAKGASFVSFDEWNSFLPPITFGIVPNDETHPWAKKLNDPEIRQACRSCSLRQADSSCTLYGDNLGQLTKIICQSVSDSDREIGIISFHLTNASAISETQQSFYKKLAEIASIAILSLRQRDREIAALRHLQSAKTYVDLLGLFSGLLNNLVQAMDVKSALIWIPSRLNAGVDVPTTISYPEERLHQIGFVPDDAFVNGLWQSVLSSKQIFSLEQAPYEKSLFGNGLLIVPLVWQSEEPAGMLILINDEPIKLNNLQKVMLQAIAGEASLLIQNSRLLVQTQYKAVVDERIRLAREIHDGLAQTLAFLKIQSTQMQNYLQTGKLDRLQEILLATNLTLAAAYQDARQAIDNLRSPASSNMRDWITGLVQDFTGSTGLPVDVSQFNMNMDPPLTAQAQLIRIMQEAFNNIRKHSQAQHVKLIGDLHSGEFIIEISDDGVGFEQEQIGLESRYGLVGMRERTDLIGGEFQIISKKGSGTTIRVSLPVVVNP